MPPYHFWEHPQEGTRIPQHRPDCGSYLVSEVYSCRACIFLKDVDGLYTADPRKDPKAELIPEISTTELKELNLPDLPVERSLIDILHLARNTTEWLAEFRRRGSDFTPHPSTFLNRGDWCDPPPEYRPEHSKEQVREAAFEDYIVKKYATKESP